MCIDSDGHHSGGSSFVYVYVIKKKKTGKESQYIVSHPKLGSDPLIGSDREWGVTSWYQSLGLGVSGRVFD